MKSIFVLFSVLLFSSVYAQDSTAKHHRLQIIYTPKHPVHRDTIVPAGRNELYFNIAPAFSALMGASPNNELTFSCFYKRTLKNPRWAMRAGFLFKPETYINDNLKNSDWYFDVTDSTRTTNILQRNRIHKYQLNVGMEWRSKGNRRWSTFAGLDLIGGIFKQDYLLYDQKETLDTTGHWKTNFGNAGFDLLDHKENMSWYVGLSPKAGLRYAFNSHWMMSLQTGFEIDYQKSNYYRRNSYGTDILSFNDNSFDLNLNALIDEFAVVYRF